MTDTCRFLVNGLGLGNSTRCHAVIEYLGTNTATMVCTYKVQYQPAGISCNVNGALTPGHVILQPINADGSSVFKQGSTVVAKFMVFDANCRSVGTAGLISSFNLVKILNGTLANAVNETVDSTTPDNSFRWDSAGQQWIFNISTKALQKNCTYVYQVTLNDGTSFQFQYGLK